MTYNYLISRHIYHRRKRDIEGYFCRQILRTCIYHRQIFHRQISRRHKYHRQIPHQQRQKSIWRSNFLDTEEHFEGAFFLLGKRAFWRSNPWSNPWSILRSIPWSILRSIPWSKIIKKTIFFRLGRQEGSQVGTQLGPHKLIFLRPKLGSILGEVLAPPGRHRAFFWRPKSPPKNGPKLEVSWYTF